MSSTTPTVARTSIGADTTTSIGVDLGVKRLLVAAPNTAGPDVEGGLVAGGEVERGLYNALSDTLDRLAERPEDTHEAEQLAIEQYRAMLNQQFALAAASLVEYAEQQDADIVVLEDLTFNSGPLAVCARGATKAGEWVLPAFREKAESVLRARGFQVERVTAEKTTQECHVCGQLAQVGKATIRCETEHCPVSRVCRDHSAAVSIAKRVF